MLDEYLGWCLAATGVYFQVGCVVGMGEGVGVGVAVAVAVAMGVGVGVSVGWKHGDAIVHE